MRWWRNHEISSEISIELSTLWRNDMKWSDTLVVIYKLESFATLYACQPAKDCRLAGYSTMCHLMGDLRNDICPCQRNQPKNGLVVVRELLVGYPDDISPVYCRNLLVGNQGWQRGIPVFCVVKSSISIELYTLYIYRNACAWDPLTKLLTWKKQWFRFNTKDKWPALKISKKGVCINFILSCLPGLNGDRSCTSWKQFPATPPLNPLQSPQIGWVHGPATLLNCW